MDREDFQNVLGAFKGYEALVKSAVMSQRQELTKTQMDVLMILEFSGKLGMSALAKVLGVSKEQVTRACGPLADRGLIERARSAQSARCVEAELSDEGRRFLEKSHREVREALEEALAPLSEAERRELFDASASARRILRVIADGR